MPGRNVIKDYVEGGYYHIYNRGVEKRDIFVDDQDFKTFLKYLRQALDPDTDSEKMRVDLSKDIDLIAYCLMPNHFHLFVKQKSTDGIAKLMRSLGTRYSMYFNLRHDRVGRLFQGTYKAALVTTDKQIMHLSRYIHLNPRGIRRGFRKYPYSSYQYYAVGTSPLWLKPGDVMELFENRTDYADFVDGLASESQNKLQKLALD